MIRLVLLLTILCVSFVQNIGAEAISEKEAEKKIKNSISIIDKEIKNIWDTWDIGGYPNFLQSAGITHTSWEVMKLKYEHKVLGTLLNILPKDMQTFVVAFMGSSVTAGHDNPVEASFVTLTGKHMKPAFDELNIAFESRQSAMGNNPCEPYDLCPKTFSGQDADVVHWEQSYNCFGNDNNRQALFEQFVRQCIHMPRHPIVVFSDSATPNWHEKDCPEGTVPEQADKRHLRGNKAASATYTDVSPAPISYIEDIQQRPDFPIGWDHPFLMSSASSSFNNRKLKKSGNGWEKTREEENLLELAKKGNYLKIASDINAPTIPKEWGANVNMFHEYQTQAGIQVWNHRHYEVYKCRGPYIPDWGCCSASWHPSLKGHELRAAHHSFYWLIILKEALINIQNKLLNDKIDLNQQLLEIDLHIEKEINHVPSAPMYESYYSNNMQCYTTFEPRFWDKGDLRSYVISSGDNKQKWSDKIIESIQQQNIIDKAKKTGYTDFKYMLYGNKENTPLSLKITIEKDNKGTFFLCEPPGNWGKLPGGFTTLWDEGATEVYITLNVDENITNNDKFNFDNGKKSSKLTYTNRKPTDSQIICVDFAPYNLPKGHHVITIVPKKDENIMISMLILPE